MRLTTVLLGMLAMVGGSGICAANLITNGSFEQGTFTDTGGGYDRLLSGSTTMPGWTVVTNEVAWAGPANGDLLVASDGGYFVDLTSYGHVDPIGGVTQTIATVPLDYYTVQLDLATFDPSFTVLVSAGASSATFTQAAGGMVWKKFGYTFQATGASTPITIQGLTGNFMVAVDNVEVNAVPTPTAVAGGLVGMAAVILRGVRRRA